MQSGVAAPPQRRSAGGSAWRSGAGTAAGSGCARGGALYPQRAVGRAAAGEVGVCVQQEADVAVSGFHGHLREDGSAEPREGSGSVPTQQQFTLSYPYRILVPSIQYSI